MGNTNSTSQGQSTKNVALPAFQLLRKLEDPHYGEIKLVRDSKTGEQIFLKEIIFDSKSAYQAELNFYNKRIAVSHPNVVRIFGCKGNDQQHFCSGYYKILIFIEVHTKTLADEVEMRLETAIPFSENDILLLAENLIAGLSYFETQNICHGDLRPENIFVTTHSYKLSDPYLNVQKNSNALTHAIVGSAKTLLAPQLLPQVPKQDFTIRCNKFKADVFSLGAILLGMASLTSSVDLYDYDNGVLDIAQLRKRLEIVRKSYSKFTYELIRDMLRINEEARPDFISLSNRLLPHQEDIRRKIEMQFFGMRAPYSDYGDEEDNETSIYASQSKIYEEPQNPLNYKVNQAINVKQDQKREKGASGNFNNSEGRTNSSKNISYSNIESQSHRENIIYQEQNHQAEPAYVFHSRTQSNKQHKTQGQIFKRLDMIETQPVEKLGFQKQGHSRQNQKQSQQINNHYSQQIFEQEEYNYQQNERPKQNLYDQKHKLRQKEQSELDQQNLHEQQQLYEMQQQELQRQKLYEQQQKQKQQEYELQQKFYEQEQYEWQQKQLYGQKNKEKQFRNQLDEGKNQSFQSRSQDRILATRQLNAENEVRYNLNGTSENSTKVYSGNQTKIEPQLQHIPAAQLYKNSENQKLSGQENVQSGTQDGSKDNLFIFENLEAKIKAALQRSETTYQMASRAHIEPASIGNYNVENENGGMNCITEASTILPTQNVNKHLDYAYPEAPLANISDFERNSVSEKVADLEDIIATLDSAKTGPKYTLSSNFLKDAHYKKARPNQLDVLQNTYPMDYGHISQPEPRYVSNMGQMNPSYYDAYDQRNNQMDQYSVHGYSNNIIEGGGGDWDYDSLKLTTNNEEGYNYNYTAGTEGIVIRKHGQTIILDE